jgi:hypothetical protein
VNALQQTGCRQLAQVTPDGILGKFKVGAQLHRHHLTIAVQPVEDILPSFSR